MTGPLKHFRLMTVRLSLIATGIAAIGLYLWGDRPAAMGMLLGGIGGTLAFWLMATRVEKLATIPKESIQLAAYRWTFFRLIIYGLVLYRAYTLDPDEYHGLFAAFGGLLLHRAILIFVAITGLDLKQKE